LRKIHSFLLSSGPLGRGLQHQLDLTLNLLDSVVMGELHDFKEEKIRDDETIELLRSELEELRKQSKTEIEKVGSPFVLKN
jgi:hypothetical protein